MAKTCALCGKPSGMYFFCMTCNKLKAEGKIEKCENCNTWHYTDKPCNCKKEEQPQKETLQPKEAKKTSDSSSATSDLTCIICGQPSNGLHFCRDCYHKYKDREIDIHIKNCSEFTITDEYGNKKIPCKDGRRVRSRAEKIIADFLFDNHVRVIYENEIRYKENNELKTLHPDFFLPDYGEIENGTQKGIIVEYNELTTKDYLKKKEYAMNIYKQKGYEVIILSGKDIDDGLLTLIEKLDLC